MSARHWLMKSEPDVFSISDLKRSRRSLWDGVRNYQARNFMMKDMNVGDQIVFYHSNAQPPGIAGLAKVCGTAVPDPSQFDRQSEYFDPKAKTDKPIWYCVEVEYAEAFPKLLPLDEIRGNPDLKELPLLRPGQRLSIQPLSQDEFKTLVAMARTAK